MVWYSHLFQNFPQFIVIHTVKGFGIVNTKRDLYLCGTFNENDKYKLLQKDPWSRAWHSSILAWRNSFTEKPDGL